MAIGGLRKILQRGRLRRPAKRLLETMDNRQWTMDYRDMHVAIITAGGAGMFCGSCMHDNTWARALLDHGVPVTLIPTYTPIRVDEKDMSTAPLFFGGINVYLEARSSLWRKLPRGLTRWL